MKALRILKDIKVDDFGLGLELNPLCVTDDVYQAIKEIEDLQQSNKDLLNTIIEAQEVIKNVLEGKKWEKWHIKR